MSGMLEAVTNLINFEEKIRADRMIAFYANKVGSSVASEEVACINSVKRVNLEIDFGFNCIAQRHNLSSCMS